MGYQEYLQGHQQLISYDYIRKSFSKDIPVELSLVERNTIEAYLGEMNKQVESLVDNVCLRSSSIAACLIDRASERERLCLLL
jgi:hypothetical protein